MALDDDVIDVTHLSEEDRKNHMRRLDELTTCPCNYCTEICDHWAHISECDPYHEWMEWVLLGRKIRKINVKSKV